MFVSDAVLVLLGALLQHVVHVVHDGAAEELLGGLGVLDDVPGVLLDGEGGGLLVHVLELEGAGGLVLGAHAHPLAQLDEAERGEERERGHGGHGHGHHGWKTIEGRILSLTVL